MPATVPLYKDKNCFCVYFLPFCNPFTYALLSLFYRLKKKTCYTEADVHKCMYFVAVELGFYIMIQLRQYFQNDVL